MIGAANDDEVFEAARDYQLVVPKESEITGTKKRSFAAGEMSAKSLRGVSWSLPVALRDAWSGNPDFADAIRSARSKGLGVYDYDVCIRDNWPAAN